MLDRTNSEVIWKKLTLNYTGGARSFAAQAGVGVSDDSSIDLPAAAYLRRELNVVLDLQNEDEELEASFEWSGIMGFSRDGNPWVGPVDEQLGGGDGLWICAGYTGHGMPNAWLCGVAAANFVLGTKQEDIDLPAGYFVNGERVVTARSYDEVWLADSKAFVDRSGF
jgi:glycine/D-amino acid oxidase-like deaminating enzyme